MDGTVIINKVPGNFHISSHANAEALHMMYMSGRGIDFSHIVHKVSFGLDQHQQQIETIFGADPPERDMDGLVIEQRFLIGDIGNIYANYYIDVN